MTKWASNTHTMANTQANSQFNPDTDRYQSIVKIGKGGMGTVYKAHDTALDKEIVIKVIEPGADYEKSAVAFQREAKTLSKLNSDNLVTVYDFGISADGTLYMILEYINGSSLRRKIKREGALSLSQSISILKQICKGLKHAHTEGVIHRDLKPDNVLIFDQEEKKNCAKVIDFGIALSVDPARSQLDIATANNTTAGTPLYMAPEIIDGKPGSERSDIYALGCLMFEMLTGSVPFRGKTLVETFEMHKQAPIPSLEGKVSDHRQELDQILALCLAKDPENRYSDMDSLIYAFDSLGSKPLEKASVIDLPETGFKEKDSKANSLPVVAACFLLVLLIGGLFYLITGYSKISPEEYKLSKEEREKKIVEEEAPLVSVAPLALAEKEQDKTPFVLEYKSSYGDMWQGNRFHLTDEQFTFLKDKTPHNLFLKHCAVKGTGLKHIPDWPLTAISFESSELTTEGLKEIIKFKSIERLDLTNTLITDSDLELLEKLPRLEHLEISYCTRLSSDGVKRFLENKKSLKSVKLNSIELDRSILPVLANSRLEALELAKYQITNDDIRYLVKDHFFHTLSFAYNDKITDEIVPELASMKGLIKIDLTGCKNISEEVRKSNAEKYKVDLSKKDKDGILKDQNELFKNLLQTTEKTK